MLGQFFGVSFPPLCRYRCGWRDRQAAANIFCRKPGTNECAEAPESFTNPPPLSHLFKIVAIFLVIWLAVILPVFAMRGMGDMLSQISLFSARPPCNLAGAYAALPTLLMPSIPGWLTEKEMLLGLGLAETTPGPLIMVTQFVVLRRLESAWQSHAAFGGHAGGLLTTFTTFLPSFMFIFCGRAVH